LLEFPSYAQLIQAMTHKLGERSALPNQLAPAFSPTHEFARHRWGKSMTVHSMGGEHLPDYHQ
jgi:hypothetical protein